MARGWESKLVESQQDDAAQKPAAGRDFTPAQREHASRKGGLELALVQTQAEIQAACRPAHREMLRLRLGAIEAQLADLA
jgi:hypothetical protein